MTKTTPKQIAVLFVVLWILIIAVFVVYIIVPMLDEKDTASEDVLYASDELVLLENDAGKADSYAEANRKLNEQLAADTSVYYNTMRNSEADKLLLAIIEGCGCKATGLGIADAVPIEDSGFVKPYTETATDESSESGEKAEPEIVYTGITVLAASYEITADYAKLLSVIEKINADKSLAIASISYEQDTAPVTNEDGSVTVAQPGKALPVQITVLVFMYPQT